MHQRYDMLVVPLLCVRTVGVNWNMRRFGFPAHLGFGQSPSTSGAIADVTANASSSSSSSSSNQPLAALRFVRRGNDDEDEDDDASASIRTLPPVNMDGSALEVCSTDPMTGFFRDGYCNTAQFDRGAHVACVQVTSEFLAFSKSAGNDLSTPRQPWFPGLTPGDRWCVCALRWKEAAAAGKAPPLVRAASHELMNAFMQDASAA